MNSLTVVKVCILHSLIKIQVILNLSQVLQSLKANSLLVLKVINNRILTIIFFYIISMTKQNLVSASIVVQVNEQLHFYLHQEFFKFFQISDMPYFLSVESNGKLSIFKLQNGNVYLKEMKSKKIGIYKILSQTSEIMTVEPFDIHNLQLKITPQITPIIQQNFDIQINISLNYIQETLPLTLFSIEQNGQEIEFDEGFEGFHEATVKDESIKNVWYLKLELNQNIIIQEFQTYILIKMFLDQNLIKEFKIIILQNYILSLVDAFQQSIIIVYDYFIYIYSFQNFQIINWVSYYTDEIIIASIYNNQIWILFKSCILYEIDISKSLNQKTFHYFKVHKGCRINSFYTNSLIIQDQEIFYKPKNKITYQLKFESRIIDVIITQIWDQLINTYFLPIIQEEQGIKISLYIIDVQEIVHLYNLPFYQYKPIQPLNYKLQSRYFMIVVLDDSNENCLLIYNIKNQGKKSLIKIIKFHKEQIVYNFIENQDIIIYIKDGKIRFNKIQEINFKLNCFDQIKNKIDFYTIKNLNVKFVSLIKSLNQYIYMPLKILHLNTIQTLAIINNQVQLINQNGYLNLSNIYGRIDKIELIHNNSFIEFNPVSYTWNRIECIFYNNDVCQISKERFMINFFTKGQNIYTQKFIQNVQSAIYDKEQSKYILICFSEVTFTVTYFELYLKFTETLNAKLTKIEKLEQTFEFHYGDFHTYVKSYYFLNLMIFSNKGKQNLILYKNNNALIRLNEIEKVIQQQILDCYQLDETTYMIAQINEHQELEFFLIQINILDNIPNQTILFKQAFGNYNQIDDFDFKSTLLIIKIISIYQLQNQNFNMQYLQCGQSLSFCVIKILRFKQTHYIDQTVIALLRIETYNYQTELVYIDSQIVIFQQKIDEDLFLIIYDISELHFKRELDYIQRIPIQNHTKIEKYNSSHYSMQQIIQVYNLSIKYQNQQQIYQDSIQNKKSIGKIIRVNQSLLIQQKKGKKLNQFNIFVFIQIYKQLDYYQLNVSHVEQDIFQIQNLDIQRTKQQCKQSKKTLDQMLIRIYEYYSCDSGNTATGNVKQEFVLITLQPHQMLKVVLIRKVVLQRELDALMQDHHAIHLKEIKPLVLNSQEGQGKDYVRTLELLQLQLLVQRRNAVMYLVKIIRNVVMLCHHRKVHIIPSVFLMELVNCSTFNGTEETCPKFLAKDDPCKSTTVGIFKGTCAKRVCTEAPNTLAANAGYQRYHKDSYWLWMHSYQILKQFDITTHLQIKRRIHMGKLMYSFYYNMCHLQQYQLLQFPCLVRIQFNMQNQRMQRLIRNHQSFSDNFTISVDGCLIISKCASFKAQFVCLACSTSKDVVARCCLDAAKIKCRARICGDKNGLTDVNVTPPCE
ncbi:unnamed protein product (macronuclear) [Paramecium tetraurelia]|uniref:Transmembrane protein n=1 Tax=Paramecium tetraurelia TaxID=5888 RepID=A0CRX0_PARTE|nr:uncharacterized protein GSPATT00038887001 [Paramecium tetraurelia]CAK73537.1 unnamed protein product [Paramecium tetraurelia]|eukprot:XP_001440934.1 hypothetical protein (macronuclear) [Paramecium tetraurelia strain d4-2]